MPDEFPPNRLVDALREPVPARPSWRASLDAALARERAGGAGETTERVPAWPPRRVSLRPAWAIAAALGFMLLGGAGTALFLGRTTTFAGRAAIAPMAAASRTTGEPVTVRFLLVAPSARRVSVVGDFNGWDPAATPMRRSGSDGDRWILELPVRPGRHTYAFYVDGDVLADPAAPRAPEEDFGVPNSLLLVGGTP